MNEPEVHHLMETLSDGSVAHVAQIEWGDGWQMVFAWCEPEREDDDE